MLLSRTAKSLQEPSDPFDAVLELGQKLPSAFGEKGRLPRRHPLQ